MPAPNRPPPLVLMIHRPHGVEAYGGYLSTAGFRVAEAKNGEHGFDQAVALLPDFIVLDFQLNGDLVARLKHHDTTSKIPIIALADLARLGGVVPVL
jgi:DNA-binding response OmpR family regulator